MMVDIVESSTPDMTTTINDGLCGKISLVNKLLITIKYQS